MDIASVLNHEVCFDYIQTYVSKNDELYLTNNEEIVQRTYIAAKVLDTLQSNGGRTTKNFIICSLHDFTLLEIERTIKYLAVYSPPKIIAPTTDDLMLPSYVNDSLPVIIADMLLAESNRCFTVGELAASLSLPVGLVLSVIEKHSGTSERNLIRCHLNKGYLRPIGYLRSLHAAVFGALLASTKPTTATVLSLALDLEETEVAWAMANMDPSQQLQLPGKFSRGGVEYTPNAFVAMQRRSLDTHLKEHKHVSLDALRIQFRVTSKLLEFVQVSFPGAIQLATIIICPELVTNFIEILKHVTSLNNVVEQSSNLWKQQIACIQLSLFLSDFLTSDDENIVSFLAQVQKYVSTETFDLETLASNVPFYLLNNDYIVQKSFVEYIFSKYKSDASDSISGMISVLKTQSKPALEPAAVDDTAANHSGKSKRKDKKQSDKDDKPSESNNSLYDKSRLRTMCYDACAEIMTLSSGGDCLDDGSELLVVAVSDRNDFCAALWKYVESAVYDVYNQATNKAIELSSSKKLLPVATRRAKEDERDKVFSDLWFELQLYNHTLLAVQSRCGDLDTSILHNWLIVCKGSFIVEVLTVFALWTVGVTYTSQSSGEEVHAALGVSFPLLSIEDRNLLSPLSKDIVAALNGMWDIVRRSAKELSLGANKSLGSKRLATIEFFEVIEKCSSQGLMALVARKLDKKKDIRSGFFNMRNSLLDFIRVSSPNGFESCPLRKEVLTGLLQLAIYDIFGGIIFLPFSIVSLPTLSSFLESLITKSDIADMDIKLIKDSIVLVLQDEFLPLNESCIETMIKMQSRFAPNVNASQSK